MIGTRPEKTSLRVSSTVASGDDALEIAAASEEEGVELDDPGHGRQQRLFPLARPRLEHA